MKIDRSRLLISFIAVLIFTLALAACGGGEEPTPTPEPPPPTAEPTEAPPPTEEPEPTEVPTEEPAPAPDFQEFSSDEAGLTMGYPTDWVSDTSMSDFLVFASSQEAIEAEEPGATDGVVLLLHGTAADFGTDDPVEALEAFIPEMDLEGEGVRGEVTETTINGNPGAIAIVDGESESGVPLTAYLTLVIDGDWAAIFVGTTPTDMEAKYLDTFAAMANTLELREPIMAEGMAETDVTLGDLEAKDFLLYGDVMNANLDKDGSDAWEFIGLEGEVIDIVVEPTGDNFDIIVDLRDDTGTSVLDAPVDVTFGKEELIAFEIPANGTYFIVVESYDGTTGEYTLTLAESGKLPVAEEIEEEDFSASSDAITIAPGSAIEYSTYYASSTAGDEAATFTFIGKAGEFADVSVAPVTEEFDVVVDLLAPSGSSLLDAPVDNSYDAEYIRILRMPEDGEYTVVVSSYDGTAGDFELLVEESYLSKPASFIFASGSIDDAEETHDFPFYTFADELVVVQVDPDIDLDAVVQVWNDDTEEMIQEEDASTGFEEIIFVAPEDGNYSFRVLGYEGATGTYDINLIGSEFVYFELAVGDLVNGRFGDNNLFEYYIGGSAGDTVSFTAKTDDDIDLVLKLVDFDDNVLVEADAGFTGEQETMSYTFTEDDLFILQISNFTETGSGEFVLSVD
ncbi:MAG: hypothetical protein IAF02_12135 [Anaerolineae bacterium]|nr:hypothetical protein [Anaerolineae bacterium]